MTEATGIVGEFLALKEETDADVLAMQCGDFYEFFAEDAETVADELDLKVSQKSSHGSTYPMAGVPLDELTPYVSALVERGFRVAVADQHETDDGHAREVTRVVTPGTLLENTGDDARYLAAVVRDGEQYGLAVADVTTGEFHVTELDAAGTDGETVDDGGAAGPDRTADEGAAAGSGGTASDGTADPGEDGDAAGSVALTELYKFDPAEVLPGPELRTDDDFLEGVRERTDAALTLHAGEAFAPGRARHRVREQFGDETLESVGVAGQTAAIRAAGAVLAYVEETGVGTLASITRLQAYGATDHVDLDATTQRNLELTETMQGDRDGSLFDTIDHTVTAAGARLLRRWLQRPQCDRAELSRRQAGVAGLAAAAMARERLREVLDDAYDLERLATRAVSGSADARDLRAVVETLERFEDVAGVVAETEELAETPLGAAVASVDRDAVAALADELDGALVADPPSSVTQGGVIDPAHDEDLAALVERHEEAREWIDTLPAREKDRTGITHLSVDRNKTDGYYVQVGKSEADQVPEEYEGIKTLKNAERFTTPELQEREREILRLEERRHDREYELFEALRERVADRAPLLQSVGGALAEVDALASLAAHAVRNDWTRPELTDGRELVVEAGRHPVVEQTTEFVPNDLRMDEDRRFLLVTGPNMSGKSTYMRQAALITLLAQVGSFVPARSATVGLVDGIYTRVGALDELAQGRSTFMVEMQELSNILHSATEDSLVILDEVGRGTSTYDGISIAWAATEYVVNEVRSKTLFATHYHELTALGERLDAVHNVHVAVAGEPDSPGAGGSSRSDESDGDVTFLRTVREGPTDRSYGVHVADLAGVPEPVVERSRDVLDRLREDEAIDVRGAGGGTVQAVFDLGSGSFQAGGEDGGGATHEADETPPGAGSEATPSDGDGSEAASADGGDPTATPAAGRDPDAGPAFGEDTAEVLEELADLDVESVPPVELLGRVQEWQERVGED